MSIGYILVNNTKEEKITFNHLPVNSMREITGNPISSAITTWYLLNNNGNDIGFVPDQYYEKDWPYKEISWDDIDDYKDMTEEIINQLINNQILLDMGKDFPFDDEPEIYFRGLKNIWE